MCIAAVRLSRRRTWQTSWARTAANWSAVRYDSIPAGRRITGRRRPTTPGSSTVGAVRISIPAGRGVADSHGVLAPTAARLLRHSVTRLNVIAANPQNQTAKSTGAIHAGCAAAETVVVGSNQIAANGALKSRAAGDATTALIGTGACCHSRSPPAAANVANGTRNLAEATNHRPYRSRARLRRNAKASSATAAANSVDCQR